MGERKYPLPHFFFSIITLDSQILENVCTKHSQVIQSNDHFDECWKHPRNHLDDCIHLADLIVLLFS